MNQYPQSRRDRDRLCDQFEKKWIGNNQFRIEDFLKQQPTEVGNPTLDELVIVEIELLHAVGQSPDATEYAARFPGQSDAIKIGFARLEEIERTQVIAATLDDPVLGQARLETSVARDIPSRVGDFQIIRRLGSGAFGVVYKATNVNSGQVYALKFPRRRSISSFLELQQIQNEAEAARNLEHPAIVKSFGLHDADGFLFIVQQFVDGQTLAELDVTDSRQIVSITAEIAEGLAHAHLQKITHRDLKPSNIMIDHTGQPLIADFGLAVHEDAQRRLKGQRCGTPQYMSPEQVMGLTHQLDGRSDIWSLGVILYQLLAGRPPFGFHVDDPDEIFEEIKTRNEKPLCMVRPDLDHELQRICLKCLAKPIRERYHSADELADDLKNWLKFEDQWQSKTYVPLIPRGLRSYGAQDAEAYLQLLPGHRDRFGIPDSVQFWKQKLEALHSSETFAVGAILGPSGSGKSSFVKAGLLPRLDPNMVRSVYVEATAANTEDRLFAALQGLSPEIPNGTSLPDVFDGLKNRVWPREDKKLLIVLDQFEQWLSNNPKIENSELAQALRHCDGTNLYCILLLRDDFWLSASRLFNLLDVGWSEDSNIQKLDLLNQDHARNVLFQIGRALKRLPADATSLSTTQKSFLNKVISDLSKNGLVICVHLTLFAEMFKKRNWTLAELSKIGGISGVGETYFEETFGPQSNTAESRLFRTEAKQVLEKLLPKPGTNLRATMCAESELRMAVANLDDARFERLMEWMDRDLRLITRTSPSRINDDSNERTGTDEPQFFQLTHDYLVPAIRNWLNRKKRETWRGRAELKLDELATIWSEQPGTRVLPSFLDFAKIKLGTNSNRLGKSHIQFLASATKYHVARIAIALTITLLVASFLGWQYYTAQKKRAQVQSQKYVESPPFSAASNLAELQRYSGFVKPVLESAQQEYPLRSALALNEIDTPTIPRMTLIAKHLGTASEFEHQFVVDRLDRYRALAIETLNKRFDVVSKLNDSKQKVRLAAALMYLQDVEKASGILGNLSDQTEATMLIHEIVNLFPNNGPLLDLVQNHQGNSDLLFGLLIAASYYDFDQWSETNKRQWVTWINREIRDNPDAGIHAACWYLMHRWPHDGWVQVAASPFRPEQSDKSWSVVEILPGHELTFVRVSANTFTQSINSPWSTHKEAYFPEKEVDVEEFWMASTETTFSLLCAWLEAENPDSDVKIKRSIEWPKLKDRLFSTKPANANINDPTLPLYGITFEETERFVKWINSESDFQNDKFKIDVVLPESKQWECAARAGSMTWFSFGSKKVADFANEYAVVEDRFLPSDGAEKRLSQPGTRIPNQFGFSDTAGNVSEYLPTNLPKDSDGNSTLSFVRGFDDCSPGNIMAYAPHVDFEFFGVRLALKISETKKPTP